MHDHHSPAYQELYEFLVNCFVHADTNMEGKVLWLERMLNVGQSLSFQTKSLQDALTYATFVRALFLIQ